MKVLTSAEMRAVDQRTMELGIPGPILMENAGCRAVEYLVDTFGSPAGHRILILCGKGNNGGDGYVIARQLLTRWRTGALWVVGTEDSSEPRRMFEAAGGIVSGGITPEMRQATLVVDAVLGTGLSGEARGVALEWIREINAGFPYARVLAVDVPSGLNSDGGPSGEVARADAVITFTAPKVCHAAMTIPWRVGHIGTPAHLLAEYTLHLNGPVYFHDVLGTRPAESNKGTYGHVMVAGGAQGKSGAAEMTGLAALRSGAGLVTVACSESRLGSLELMTAPFPHSFDHLPLAGKQVLAMGPGMGIESVIVRGALERWTRPLVLDADALNSLGRLEWTPAGFCVITPHPGEMARLTGLSVAEVQADRLGVARAFASSHRCCVVLKGHRTVIAFPDGRAWVNPSGSPSMATAGSGDILTGIVAGLVAQTADHEAAVLAAVWLHGRAGELGAADLGERSLIATDLLRYLPEALRECQNVPDHL